VTETHDFVQLFLWTSSEGPSLLGFDSVFKYPARHQHLDLALEAGHAVGVLREALGQDFDGHVAPELGVGSAVDFPHATGADGIRISYGPSRVPVERVILG